MKAAQASTEQKALVEIGEEFNLQDNQGTLRVSRKHLC